MPNNATSRRPLRLLAVNPISRGFGFAVLEGSERLVDWGIREIRTNKNVESRKKITELIRLYRPDVLVTEDVTRKCRRCRRIRSLIRSLETLARKEGVSFSGISRIQIRAIFASNQARNKDQIARALVTHMPELLFYLPPRRKCWMSEDPRMGLFVAVSFAYTFYRDRSLHDRSQLA